VTRPRRCTGLAAVVAAGLALVLVGCSRGGGPDVAVATVGRADVVEVVDAPATVEARAQATATAPADGTVATLLVTDGAKVKAGQPLLRISSPSAVDRLRRARQADAQAAAATPSTPRIRLTGFQGQVDSAATAAFDAARTAAAAVPEAQRAQALAAVTTAEARYAAARAQALAALRSIERGIGSVTSSLASLGAAQRVQTQAAVDIAQSTVDALLVRAPIGGTVQLGGSSTPGATGGLDALVGSLPAAVQGQAAQALNGSSGSTGTASGALVAGAPVGSGAVVATVYDLSSLRLSGAVDETDIFLVRRGVVADVELDAVPDARYSATVVAVDLSPTESSRGGVTYGVHLALGPGRLADGGPAPRPRPGMSAVVDLKVRSAKQAVAVPAAAVVRQGARDAVWLVVNGRARSRVVKLGAQGDDVVAVVDGVRPGDVVVSRGADSVTEGQRVP
jgi:multidrug efflux pump subunit AcrA (membrane-fusion protein)